MVLVWTNKTTYSRHQRKYPITHTHTNIISKYKKYVLSEFPHIFGVPKNSPDFHLNTLPSHQSAAPLSIRTSAPPPVEANVGRHNPRLRNPGGNLAPRTWVKLWVVSWFPEKVGGMILLVGEIRRSPVEVGTFKPLFARFYTSQVVVWDFWTINSM